MAVQPPARPVPHGDTGTHAGVHTALGESAGTGTDLGPFATIPQRARLSSPAAVATASE
jgi:hypothetical protein